MLPMHAITQVGEKPMIHNADGNVCAVLFASVGYSPW